MEHPRLHPRAARERLGLTRLQAAERTGINQATLWRYETGKGIAAPWRIARMAEAYGLDWSDRWGLVLWFADLEAGREIGPCSNA